MAKKDCEVFEGFGGARRVGGRVPWWGTKNTELRNLT